MKDISHLPEQAESFKNVIVSPMVELLQELNGLSYHKGGPHWPDWDKQTIARHYCGRMANDQQPDPIKAEEVYDKSAAWCGPIVNHFGHQLADFSMRIFSTIHFQPSITLVFSVAPDSTIDSYENMPNFFKQTLDWFNVSIEQVKIVKVPTLFTELIVFPQAERLGSYFPDQKHLDALDLLCNRKFSHLEPIKAVYVSRSSFSLGSFAGESYLDSFFEQQGAIIFYPERYSLEDQLKIYLSAEYLIFSEGSAIHSLQLLGHLKAKVSVIGRRKANWDGWNSVIVPRTGEMIPIDAFESIIAPLGFLGDEKKSHGITILNESKLKSSLVKLNFIDISYWNHHQYLSACKNDILKWSKSISKNSLKNSRCKAHIIKSFEDIELNEIAKELQNILPNLPTFPLSTIELKEEAIQLIDNAQYELAKKILLDATKKAPVIPEFYLLLHLIYTKENKYSLANNARKIANQLLELLITTKEIPRILVYTLKENIIWQQKQLDTFHSKFETDKSVLEVVDINTIRDAAIATEKLNLELAYKLMGIAHKANSKGSYIKQKLESYKKLLKKD